MSTMVKLGDRGDLCRIWLVSRLSDVQLDLTDDGNYKVRYFIVHLYTSLKYE